jgi:hypothetical protein
MNINIDPNSRQVGGSHYRRDFQHWDLMAFAKADYFSGQITKYSERHDKKNGRQDLEKALHFAEKNLEVRSLPAQGKFSILRSMLSSIFPPKLESYDPEVARAIRRYAVEAGLTALQERIFECCLLEPHDPRAVVALCQLHLQREYDEKAPKVRNLRVVDAAAPNINDAQRLMMEELQMPGTPDDGGHHATAVREIDDAEFDEMLQRSLDDLSDLKESEKSSV